MFLQQSLHTATVLDVFVCGTGCFPLLEPHNNSVETFLQCWTVSCIIFYAVHVALKECRQLIFPWTECFVLLQFSSLWFWYQLMYRCSPWLCLLTCWLTIPYPPPCRIINYLAAVSVLCSTHTEWYFILCKCSFFIKRFQSDVTHFALLPYRVMLGTWMSYFQVFMPLTMILSMVYVSYAQKRSNCRFLSGNVICFVGLSSIAVFVRLWDIMLCSLLKVNWPFEGTCCLHFHGRRISQARNQSEARQPTLTSIEPCSIIAQKIDCYYFGYAVMKIIVLLGPLVCFSNIKLEL
jgi:hypothetical protein